MIYCPNCGGPLQPREAGGNRIMACASCGYVLDGSSGVACCPESAEPAAGLQPVVQAQPQPAAQPDPQPATQMPGTVPPQAGDGGYWGTRGTGPAAAEARRRQQAPCGVPAPAASLPAQALPKGMAVAALVLGILAIVNCWIPAVNLIAVVLGAIAIALGFTARSRARKGLAAGAGMGLAGAVLGIVAAVLSLLISLGALAVAYLVYDGAYTPIGSGSSQVQPGGRGDSSPGAAVQGGADDGAWTSLEFTFEGSSFQLGDTELEDFEDETGWVLDLQKAGYPDGYIVQPGQEITSIDLADPDHPDDYVWVSVMNSGTDQCDLKECELSRITVGNPSGTLSCTAAEGVGLGSAVDEVIAVYGTPAHDYSADGGSYRSLTYIGGDYRKQIELTATEGAVVDEFSMALL